MREPAPQSLHAETDTWLSALLDGESDDDAASIGRVARDESLRARWNEYCLIGDAMRGMPRLAGRLPERVRATLADEPTVLAPPAAPRARPLAWLAAAATVAAVTWLTVRVEPGVEPPAQMATRPGVAELAAVDVLPYLSAHQDYAQALTSNPEMRFSQVALTLPEAAR